MLGLFDSLDIGPNKTFDPAALEPATAAGLRRAVEIGPQILQADFTTRLGQTHQRLADSHRPRQLDHPGHRPTRLSAALSDRQGSPTRPATGRSDLPDGVRYRRRRTTHRSEQLRPKFPAGRPATGRCVLVGRALRRRRFRHRQPHPPHPGRHLRRHRHRTRRISDPFYIQHDTPGTGNESNWLPSPGGSFNLAMRLYKPQAAALTLDWTPPAVERVPHCCRSVMPGQAE